MASPMTSIDNAWVKYPKSDIWFVTMMKRPVYDSSLDYCWPTCNKTDGTRIMWHNGYGNDDVEMIMADGTHYKWLIRPTIQDVIDKKLGDGVYAKFNGDGSIYLRWDDGFTWYHGPLNVETSYETNVFDDYNYYDDDDDDNRPCERCRQWRCECGTWSRY